LTPYLGADVGNRLALEKIVSGSLRGVVLGCGVLLLPGQALNGGVAKILADTRDIALERPKGLARFPSQTRHRLRVVFRLLYKAMEVCLVLF
jgi:hypothetical protein